MSVIKELRQLASGRVQVGLDQNELDDCGHLLDRLEELEVYVDSPSLNEYERQNAIIEMQDVIEKVHYYTEYA